MTYPIQPGVLFSYNARQERERQGISQKEMVRRMEHPTKTSYNRMENSVDGWKFANRPGWKEDVARVLGVSVETLESGTLPVPCPYCYRFRTWLNMPVCGACGCYF